jgi:hypothetical protein
LEIVIAGSRREKVRGVVDWHPDAERELKP